MSPRGRRERQGTSAALRLPAEPRAPAEGTARTEYAPKLRLFVARGGIGLELEAPVTMGAWRIDHLAARLPDVRFPIDLSGGVQRFRHRRGQLLAFRATSTLRALEKHLSARLRGLWGDEVDPPSLVLAPIASGVRVGLASERAAIAFDVRFAPLERALRLVVDNARGAGLDAPQHAVALQMAASLLGPDAERVGSGFILRDALTPVLRAVLPIAGARVPALGAGQFHVEIASDAESTVSVEWAAEADVRALHPAAVRALEIAELLVEVDDALARNELDRARTCCLAVLERVPRHPAAALRLAAIDASFDDRHEAVLSTLADVVGVVDAGWLGSVALEHTGDREAAYVAAARAAAAEPDGAVAGHLWLRAGRLASERPAAVESLDQAVTRAPRLRAARWARLALRLRTGDLRGARADAEHLEAAAHGPEARHAECLAWARALAETGRTEEAVRAFERALRYRPRDPSAVAGLARALADLGQRSRAVDLYARAIALLPADADDRARFALELATIFADRTEDVPAALARVASIGADCSVAHRARVLEARLRADLEDAVGAARATARLRMIAEARGEGVRDEELARALVEASAIDLDRLGDPMGAERDLHLALRLAPESHHVATALRRVARLASESHAERGASAEVAASRGFVEKAERRAPIVPIASGSTPSPDTTASSDDESLHDEALVARLSERLRAEPTNDALAVELAGALERLGNDLELLALVSARIDEAPPAERTAWQERRVGILASLASKAVAAGRDDEAALYESLLRES